MNRFEKFRYKRINRRKYVVVASVSIIFIMAGILTVNYSMSKIMYNDKVPQIVSLRVLDNSNLEISLAGKKVCFDMEYVKRDIELIESKVIAHGMDFENKFNMFGNLMKNKFDEFNVFTGKSSDSLHFKVKLAWEEVLRFVNWAKGKRDFFWGEF